MRLKNLKNALRNYYFLYKLSIINPYFNHQSNNANHTFLWDTVYLLQLHIACPHQELQEKEIFKYKFRCVKRRRKFVHRFATIMATILILSLYTNIYNIFLSVFTTEAAKAETNLLLEL